MSNECKLTKSVQPSKRFFPNFIQQSITLNRVKTCTVCVTTYTEMDTARQFKGLQMVSQSKGLAHPAEPKLCQLVILLQYLIMWNPTRLSNLEMSCYNKGKFSEI